MERTTVELNDLELFHLNCFECARLHVFNSRPNSKVVFLDNQSPSIQNKRGAQLWLSSLIVSRSSEFMTEWVLLY